MKTKTEKFLLAIVITTMVCIFFGSFYEKNKDDNTTMSGWCLVGNTPLPLETQTISSFRTACRAMQGSPLK